MRPGLLRAGLTGAAVISLACSARFVAARTEPWPEPTIVVAPGRGGDAAAVSIDGFSQTVINRLQRLRSMPLRGGLDAFGKDSLRAWDWMYLGRSALLLYRLNHDRRLVDAVLDIAAAYEADGRQYQALDGYGWYTVNTATGKAYREVSIAGLVMAPVTDLLLAEKSDPELQALIAPHRAALTGMLARGTAGLERGYIEDAGGGYYLLPTGDDIEPINLMSIYATSLLGYWQLTGDAQALRQSTGIARTWATVLQTGADGATSWPHTARPGRFAGRPNPAETLYKGAAAIEFPLAAYRAGIGLTRRDMVAIARVPQAILLAQIDQSHYRLRESLQRNLDRFVGSDPAQRALALRPSAWYLYACYEPGLAPLLDRYLFGLDPQFYLHDGVAMLALAQRLSDGRTASASGCAQAPGQVTAQARIGSAVAAGSDVPTSATTRSAMQ